MRGIFVPAILVMSVVACSLFTPRPAATPPPAQPTQPQPPAPTQAPASTETAVPTDVPTATVEPSPEPSATATLMRLPQQWNGTYTYTTGQKQNISFLIEKMKDNTFTGKMIWVGSGNFRGAILKMNGEFVTDFGDQAEQAKWNELSDYQDGIKTGTYLKWTETEILDGRNYTVNGWYYAHMRENDTMVAVYFYSKDAVVADAGAFIFQKVGP